MKNNRVGKSFLCIIRKNKRLAALLLLSVVGVVFASLMPPQIFKRVIDNNLALKSSDGLITLAVLYIVVILLIGVFNFIKEAVLTIFGQKISREIRIDMMKKLEKINMGFFTSSGTGEVVSRFSNDVDAINSMFTNGIVGMMVDCFKIIGITISVWIFSAVLGKIVLILLPVIYIITRYFQKRMLKEQIKTRILIQKVNNHIGESIRNILMIKAYSKEDYMEEKYKDVLLENYKTIEKVNFYDSVFPPIIQIIRAVVIGTIVIISSRQLNVLGMTLGMVAGSIDLISNLFAPIEELGMEFQNIQQALSGIYRVNSFLNEAEDDRKNKDYTAEKIITSLEAVTLEFHHVSFQYEEDNDILENISIKINPYEKVTFVGRTGVGKSTLFKLILGLLKPTEGNITLNGIDVYAIPNSEKRKLFGYVNQSFHMINGTVGDQISLLDESIQREQIREALDYVGMLEYVDSLKEGMDTIIINDNLFSQGQKQLLSIARAIVTNPPLLLLDEITANLDSITEEKIESVLHKASSSHIILQVSHRLSSMVASDTIVILENGRIKNYGSPKTLLQEDEWYRSQIAIENLTWS